MRGRLFEPSPHTLPYRPEGSAPSDPDGPKLAVRVSAHPGNGMCPSWERKPSVGLQHATQVTPSPLTPRFGSAGTETMGPNGARIGVLAAWHRPQKSKISDVRTRAKLSSTPAVYPWSRGSRSGIPIPMATVDRKPANTQPSALRCGRGKPRPSGRGGCH